MEQETKAHRAFEAIPILSAPQFHLARMSNTKECMFNLRTTRYRRSMIQPGSRTMEAIYIFGYPAEMQISIPTGRPAKSLIPNQMTKVWTMS